MNACVMRFFCSMPEPYYGWMRRLANAMALILHPERVQSLGPEHPDKTFYVVDTLSSEVGLAGWFDTVLGYMARAESKGWHLVVKSPVPIQDADGTWSDFFRIAGEVEFGETARAMRVVRARPLAMIYKRYNRREIGLRHRLTKKVVLSDEAASFVSKRLSGIFENAPSPMVAVRFRGTDYRTGVEYCPVGHAKVPDMDWFCERVIGDLNRWGIPIEDGSHLFVVTEEQEAMEEIKRRFPRCRYVVKERYANFTPGQYLVHHKLPTMTPRENNMMYLLEIVGMSRCDYLIGGINGGVLMALNLNGNRYRAVDVLNTGVS